MRPWIAHIFPELWRRVSSTLKGVTDDGDPALGYADGSHAFGVHRQISRIDWYIDGTVVFSYEGDDVAYQVINVIANLAVCGPWSGSLNSET